MSTVKYNKAMRLLHWIMALIILGLIAVGLYMTGLEKEDPSRGELYALHKSFGVTIVLLLSIRILVRLGSFIPPLPNSLSSGVRMLARAVQGGLYMFMLIVPLSGFIMSDAGGHGVKLFGYPLPKIFPDDKLLAGIAHEAHELLPYILLGLVALHVAGALKHRFFDRKENDVLGRML